MTQATRRDFYAKLQENPLYRELLEYITTFSVVNPAALDLSDVGSILKRERAFGIQLNSQMILDFISGDLQTGGERPDETNETTADTPEP